ncbi:MAG TPA: Zn-ribbon domain-containing OB-fold protein [Streptosporangiaceae bacterium]|nr:Zn-ribbon domain-containing OB-fold protein [Streptosporangiaceae bacterium]
MADQPQRPMPLFPEPDTEPFWAATASRRLTYQVCRACGQVVFHPRRHCTCCTSGDLEWRDSAGAGTVYTFTVIRRSGHPFFREKIPYIVGLIDLDEGFRMLAEIAADPETLHVDDRVTVTWEDHADLSVPIFQPQ